MFFTDMMSGKCETGHLDSGMQRPRASKKRTRLLDGNRKLASERPPRKFAYLQPRIPGKPVIIAQNRCEAQSSPDYTVRDPAHSSLGSAEATSAKISTTALPLRATRHILGGVFAKR